MKFIFFGAILWWYITCVTLDRECSLKPATTGGKKAPGWARTLMAKIGQRCFRDRLNLPMLSMGWCVTAVKKMLVMQKKRHFKGENEIFVNNQNEEMGYMLMWE